MDWNSLAVRAVLIPKWPRTRWIKPEDLSKEKAYWFTCDLNEDDTTKVDPFILIEVCDPDAEDYEELYTIDLSVDEQNSMYRIFDRQLKNVGKTCACLLQEAWE